MASDSAAADGERVSVSMTKEEWDVVLHTLEEEMAQLAPLDDEQWLGERPQDEDANAVADVHGTIMAAVTEETDD